MLIFRSGEEGGHDQPGLPPGKALFVDYRQQPFLVAALQPGQLRTKAGREKPEPDTLLRFIREPLDQCQSPTDPALVTVSAGLRSQPSSSHPHGKANAPPEPLPYW